MRADALELVHLGLAEARQAVAETVGQRVLGEAAVATGRAERDVLRLDDEDVALGVALLRDQRRPQAGEAAADDREIALELTRDRRARLGRGMRVQPVRPRHRTGEEVVEAAGRSRRAA